jgi:hypothetical protein
MMEVVVDIIYDFTLSPLILTSLNHQWICKQFANKPLLKQHLLLLREKSNFHATN